MNIKESMGRRRGKREVDAELSLTAVMNVFLILVPFLLLTAVFVRIAVLELTLPNLQRTPQSVQEQSKKAVVLNFLFIKETGFELKVPELKLSKLPKKKQVYDWEGLISQLNKAKSKHPESQDIIITPEDEIKYDTIISVMDKCRESGFPNISISG